MAPIRPVQPAAQSQPQLYWGSPLGRVGLVLVSGSWPGQGGKRSWQSWASRSGQIMEGWGLGHRTVGSGTEGALPWIQTLPRHLRAQGTGSRGGSTLCWERLPQTGAHRGLWGGRQGGVSLFVLSKSRMLLVETGEWALPEIR